MSLYLKLTALLRHPLSGERRKEFRRNYVSLPEQLDKTRQQLLLANNALQQAVARHDELIRHHDEVEQQHKAAFIALRGENAALAEHAVTAADLNSALARIAADSGGLTRAAAADAVAAQLSDVRDRLASRLELLTSEVSDVRRSISAGGQDGSDETRRLYLDLLESALTGVLTRDRNAAPWGKEEFDPERRLYGRDWPKSAMTMIGTARMRNLRRLVETALPRRLRAICLRPGYGAAAPVFICAASWPRME